MTKFRINLTVSGIQAAISDHFKVFFWNMPDQTFDEIHNRESFFHICIIFVAVVVKCNSFSVIVVNPGCGDHGSSKIATDIFGDCFWVTEIGFCIDIEAVPVLAVAFRFYFFKRRPNPVFQFIEKGSAESLTEIVVVKMFYMTPVPIIAVPSFRKETVDVRIPFEVPSECMQYHDIAGSVIFGMVEIEKHTRNYTGDRMEETV